MRAERPSEMIKPGAFFHPTGNHGGRVAASRRGWPPVAQSG